MTAAATAPFTSLRPCRSGPSGCHGEGYGGNQKTCYLEALRLGAEVLVMLHPDGQYDPVVLADLVAPLRHRRPQTATRISRAKKEATATTDPSTLALSARRLASFEAPSLDYLRSISDFQCLEDSPFRRHSGWLHVVCDGRAVAQRGSTLPAAARPSARPFLIASRPARAADGPWA